MKTYVINLESSPERKVYMQGILKRMPFLSVEFIFAVDGKVMPPRERHVRFSEEKFKKRYSHTVRPGEIGCTLSHQLCYRKMVTDGEPYVLILEDDVVFAETNIEPLLEKIAEEMRTEEPRVILLSGWYWYWRASSFTGRHKLARVYDAFLTHSYVINQAAARLLIEEHPFITADDWRYISKKGARLQAVLPHVVDQKWDGEIVSTIQIEERKQPGIIWKMRHFFHLLTLKLLYFSRHFEKA